MSDEMTVTIDGEDYLLRPEADTVKVGRRVGGDTTWLEDVDPTTFPEGARRAPERGDSPDAAPPPALSGGGGGCGGAGRGWGACPPPGCPGVPAAPWSAGTPPTRRSCWRCAAW